MLFELFESVPPGHFNSYLAVAMGGAIGALLRFTISEWYGSQATLLVNAVGSLLLGMYGWACCKPNVRRIDNFFGHWDLEHSQQCQLFG